jgi:hypothetical protein
MFHRVLPRTAEAYLYPIQPRQRQVSQARVSCRQVRDLHMLEAAPPHFGLPTTLLA